MFSALFLMKFGLPQFHQSNKWHYYAKPTLEVKKKLDETEEEILTILIVELRQTYESEAKEIVTNIPLEIDESRNCGSTNW
jgi:hypothetical protein